MGHKITKEMYYNPDSEWSIARLRARIKLFQVLCEARPDVLTSLASDVYPAYKEMKNETGFLVPGYILDEWRARLTWLPQEKVKGEEWIIEVSDLVLEGWLSQDKPDFKHLYISLMPFPILDPTVSSSFSLLNYGDYVKGYVHNDFLDGPRDYTLARRVDTESVAEAKKRIKRDFSKWLDHNLESQISSAMEAGYAPITIERNKDGLDEYEHYRWVLRSKIFGEKQSAIADETMKDPRNIAGPIARLSKLIF